jgi:AraC family transcriptional regulator, melibiose operon regulatory protein
MTADPAPLHEVFGLACGLSLRPSMARAHRHDDIELILPLDGSAVLEHAGGRHDLTDRSCAVFWAGRPHRVVDHDDGMTVAWLTVPLVDVLAWSLPASFTGDMLRGGLSTFDAPPALESAMGSWQDDIGASPALTHAVRLEAHAWLLRASSVGHASAPTRSHDSATAMASYVSMSFREPLTVADVASVVHLHPSTAAAVFRRDMGVTIGEYLAQCRVAEAQRLLISTQATTSDIALRSGFGSTSRLYERFGRDVGMSPGAYRRLMR